jgi:anti-sigma regulatory factor (Ser/Thr protein kinase)
MSLGLPSHLARSTKSRALATASHWGGLVCLAAAAANVVIAGFDPDAGVAWWVLLALILMAGLLVLLSRRRTATFTIVYLVVGTATTYLYTATVLRQTPSFHNTDLFTVALPVVAMTLVGGAGAGALVGIIWSTVGFALAEIAVAFAALGAHRDYVPDAVSLSAYLLMVCVLLFDAITSGGRRVPQSTIHRAIRDDQMLHIRHELASESAAELHDNSLSELVTIANSSPGPLRPALRRQIELDLRRLGQDRFAERAPGLSNDAGELWLGSELHAAIEELRDEGLAIEVSGERDALARLTEVRRRAIGLAVRQCLVNVLRHSGSAAADVAVSASENEISVMVVDAGRGFDQTEAAVDRIGLRHSVHERIERVGGTVRIWSSPDVGTTVMMVVPCDDLPQEGLAS